MNGIDAPEHTNPPQGTRVRVGRTAEILAWGDGLVLKLLSEGLPKRMAEEEARATGRLHELGLPVPRVEGVVEEQGRHGIVLERIQGPSMLSRLTRFPWPVTRMARVLANLHRSIHRHRVPELPPLRGELDRRIREAPGLSVEEKGEARDALRELPDDSVVYHGDFHPGNILLAPQGPVVIDWIDAHRVHPSADVARTILLLRLGELPEGTSGRWLINRLRRRFLRAYLKRYEGIRPLPPEELKAWSLPVAAARLADGIPQEQRKLVAMVRATLADAP
ncbi:MAG: phosphotransferase family protein [Thermoplasmata archaeon]